MRRRVFLHRVERMTLNVAEILDKGRGPNFDPYYFNLSGFLISMKWMEDIAEEETDPEKREYFLRIGKIYAQYVWDMYFKLGKRRYK